MYAYVTIIDDDDDKNFYVDTYQAYFPSPLLRYSPAPLYIIWFTATSALPPLFSFI